MSLVNNEVSEAKDAENALSSDPQVQGEEEAPKAEPRFQGPVNNLTAEQVTLQQEILASRPRTGLSGPFGPWLAVPALARPAQELGRVCRYETSLSFRESELVILLTAAKTRSSTEFAIHTPEALQAGLSKTLIEAIPRGYGNGDVFSCAAVKERVCSLLKDARERAIAAFAAELLETSHVSDATYAETRAQVEGQDRVLVEITSIVGYYTLVAYTLNVFRI